MCHVEYNLRNAEKPQQPPDWPIASLKALNESIQQFSTVCPTLVLNIGDSSIGCLEKNTDVQQQIQTLTVKTDYLVLKLGSKK